MTGPEATCPECGTRWPLGRLVASAACQAFIFSQVRSPLPHMALSLVEWAVVSPLLRFAEAPSGFLGTVDFIYSTRGHVYRYPEPEQFGICVSHESSTELGGPEQPGQSHELCGHPTLCAFLLCRHYGVLPRGHIVIAEAPGITS